MTGQGRAALPLHERRGTPQPDLASADRGHYPRLWRWKPAVLTRAASEPW